MRRCPPGHYAVDHWEHERGEQTLCESDGHQGRGAERLDSPWAGYGQQGRHDHADGQQQLLVISAAEYGCREVGQQVADKERAEQRRSCPSGPFEYRHVLCSLGEVVRRVHHRVHGHDRYRQVHAQQVPGDHTQEQQQALQVPDTNDRRPYNIFLHVFFYH